MAGANLGNLFFLIPRIRTRKVRRLRATHRTANSQTRRAIPLVMITPTSLGRGMH